MARDDDPADAPPDRLDRLVNDLTDPLTAIHGRAHLLARTVRRSPGLAADERERLLRGLSAIAEAARAQAAAIAATHPAPRVGRNGRTSRADRRGGTTASDGAQTALGSGRDRQDAPGSRGRRVDADAGPPA